MQTPNLDASSIGRDCPEAVKGKGCAGTGLGFSREQKEEEESAEETQGEPPGRVDSTPPPSLACSAWC